MRACGAGKFVRTRAVMKEKSENYIGRRRLRSWKAESEVDRSAMAVTRSVQVPSVQGGTGKGAEIGGGDSRRRKVVGEEAIG